MGQFVAREAPVAPRRIATGLEALACKKLIGRVADDGAVLHALIKKTQHSKNEIDKNNSQVA